MTLFVSQLAVSQDSCVGLAPARFSWTKSHGLPVIGAEALAGFQQLFLRLYTAGLSGRCREWHTAWLGLVALS